MFKEFRRRDIFLCTYRYSNNFVLDGEYFLQLKFAKNNSIGSGMKYTQSTLIWIYVLLLVVWVPL